MMSWKRRGNRADGEREPEAEPDVDGDGENRRQRGVDAAPLQIGADDRPDDFAAQDFIARQAGLGQGVEDLLRPGLQVGALLRGLALGQPDQPLVVRRVAVLLDDFLAGNRVDRVANLLLGDTG